MSTLAHADPLDPGILRAGAACGLLAALIYPLWTLVDLPAPINRLLHFAFGPLLVVAFLGLDRWVQRQRPSFARAMPAWSTAVPSWAPGTLAPRC